MNMITVTAAVRPFRKSGALWTAIAYVAAMRENRRTLHDINAMEEHILRDIGLTSTDLMRVNVAKPGADRMAMLSRARSRGMV